LPVPHSLDGYLGREHAAMKASLLQFVDEHFEKMFCCAFLMLLVACLGAQIVMRYCFQMGLTWAEELSRFAFVWTIYLGMSLAAKQEQHVRVTAQYLLVPRRFRPYIWLFSDLVWIFFNLAFTYEGIGWVVCRVCLHHHSHQFHADDISSFATLLQGLPEKHLA
jgi:TRAP-type C4-dicarboxylate transport system permease small subunit